MSTPSAVRRGSPFIDVLSALGLANADAPAIAIAGGHSVVLATLTGSETFRWLRRWAVVAVVAIITPLSVITAFANQMPDFHHVAVPIAVAVVVPAWVLELSGVRWPRFALIAATVLPNVWLTLVGHISTNYLWLLLLVGWIAFAGTRLEGLVALVLSLSTVAFGQIVIVAPAIEAIDWAGWTEASFALILTWFMGLVLRRQVVLAADLRLLREESDQRRHQIEALYKADELIYRSLRIDEVLQSLVDVASDLLHPDKVAVGILDAQTDRIVVGASRGFSASTVNESLPPDEVNGLRGWLDSGVVVMEDVEAESRLPARIRAANLREGVRSSMTAPIRLGDEVIGAFGLSYCQPRTFTADEERLLLSLAQRAALAIQNARLYEQSQRAATLEERQRLSRELHDSVTQALYGIALYAEAGARALAEGDVGPVASNLREIGDTTQEALSEMRLLLFELRPPMLQERGLGAALRARLQAVEARSGLVTEFDFHGDERLPSNTEQELYRLAQEALNNVQKHAHAGRVSVRLATVNDHTTMEVADDGVGFEPNLQGTGGFGLPGMRERVERLGGTLRIDSSPGAGTRIQVAVPR